MRAALLALSLLVPAAATASASEPVSASEAVPKLFREGRWKMAVSGVLCNACTKAIVERLKKVEGVADASFDYEEGSLHMTVARGHRVRAPLVERALHVAGHEVDLGTRFALKAAAFEGPELPTAEKAAPPPTRIKAPPPKPVLPPADFPAPAP
ncbi:MAG: heavy-metal-associated domain-containing protein [Elusimicrobia bacterium]|nr:heavy-metal-associated domain-containing protein [Elusimicrobiota bacterium]